MTDRREREEGYSEARRLREEAKALKRKQALKLVRDGLSQNEVAQRIGMCRQALRRLCAEEGLTAGTAAKGAGLAAERPNRRGGGSGSGSTENAQGRAVSGDLEGGAV